MAGSTELLETVREEDFVEYFIFPYIESNDESEQSRILTNILTKANKIVETYTNNFLWHKDGFKLTPKINNVLDIASNAKKENLPCHLYGISHYGDNIEDEWFIVFLLLELTKEITGLIVKVYDADGEFLLIEAADYLPSWTNPENCENRVYIYDGSIHLIPPESEEDDKESITEALEKIRDTTFETLASNDIQKSIKAKLEGYPQKTQDNLHMAAVYIPAGIAAILKHNPNVIAPAIQAFCNRDPVDLKICRAMKYFPPENRVMMRVTFTKCLYAMLTHSKYLPDRRTGWNLPSVNSPHYKAHLLGLKIACGFEILVSQAKPKSGIEGDKGWHIYLQSLTDKGYFRGLLEHSKDYNNLLNKAKDYYLDSRDSMYYSPVIGQTILELTKNLEYNIEDLKKEGENLPKDDDDSWLNISPEELDKMLEEKYGQKRMLNVNNNSDASSFTQNLSKFLNHVSEVEGAEFPNEDDPPVRPPRNKNKSKVSFSKDAKKESESSNKINFDPNSFSCAVQNILNFVVPEDDSWDLETDSDLSEYENDNYVKDQSYNEVKSKMQEYMEEMDKELAKTTIGESFEKKNDTFDDIEDFKPVDIDVNALKNILESYRSQLGEAGPSSNMLGPMGIHLDPKTDKKIN